MARMGHDSERAAMIYQHAVRGADQLITNAIDAHVHGEQRKIDDEDRSAGIWSLRANGTPMARKINNGSWRVGGQTPIPAVTWVLALGPADRPVRE
jgi:hypothetical protein